jgi:hypothetical protein
MDNAETRAKGQGRAAGELDLHGDAAVVHLVARSVPGV